MIALILGLFLHALFFFGAVVVAIIMEDMDYVDDREIYMIIAIFIPLGVLLWLGGIYVGEKISASLT